MSTDTPARHRARCAARLVRAFVSTLPTAALLAAALPTTPANASGCPNEALRTGPSANLPDCRAYEQVSPVDKAGVVAYPDGGGAVQVTSFGDRIAYTTFNAFPGALGNTASEAAHVSRRDGNGWQTAEWTPPVPEARVLLAYTVDYTFSADLSQAVLGVPVVELTPGATPYAKNLYLSNAPGSYSLVNLGKPARSVEEQCPSLEELSTCYSFADHPAVAGASQDFSRVFFESNAQLLPEAPETGFESLYESSSGVVRLVGILPDNTVSSGATAGSGSSASYTSSFQTADGSVERAVSTDGSHVVFQAPADGGLPDVAQNGQVEVYDRINHAETIEISQPAAGATPAVTTPESATFQSASTDGQRIFFTSSAELTTQSKTGLENNSETLYEYNLQTKQITDLTVDTNPADAATGPMVRGVFDSSIDGSYIYFVASGQFDEGKGVDGEPNLYMVHNGEAPVYITTLDGAGGACDTVSDVCDWGPHAAQRHIYLTPDGAHLAFMSKKSLITANFPGGYDNTDTGTGRPDAEVYEYTAPAGGEEGQLVCASCDAGGAPPSDNALMAGVGLFGPLTEPNYTTINTAFYRVRSMSDNGNRLFYFAPAPGGLPEYAVYEYEQAGEGSCADASGCRSVIVASTPKTLGESSKLLGASSDGRDLFFATSKRLLSSDTDQLTDVYDARVDGGTVSPPTGIECEAACQQAVAPQTGRPTLTLSTGSSGNLPPPAVNTAPKPLTRPQLLAKALRACRRDRRSHKRHLCEARARKHYRSTASGILHQTDRSAK